MNQNQIKNYTAKRQTDSIINQSAALFSLLKGEIGIYRREQRKM